ncbi:MAG: hypothetical protein AAFO07_27315 [Bacteroidota bacterium]
MIRILATLSVIVFFALPNSVIGNTSYSVSFNFYNQKVTIRYSPGIVINAPISPSERTISNYYKLIKRENYTSLLQDLRYYRNHLLLNDWLLYKMVYLTAREIISSDNQLQVELLCWFILNELGYETRVTYLHDQVYVYAYTIDEIYEIPLITDQGKTFANLTSFRSGKTAEMEELFLLNYRPRSNFKPFTFLLSFHPIFPKKIKQRLVEFSYQGRNYSFLLKIDQNIIQILEDYPYFAEEQYLEFAFSKTAFESLIPPLKEALKDKGQIEAIELMVSFTRSSFDYKEDKSFFGKSKPMVAEEVLYYPYSDCEDRSALFYQLVKILLDLPMIIIAFDDHLTIAVALENFEGQAIEYKNKKYYICDPTGPANSSTIGFFPKGYENKAFKIIGSYK